MSDLDSKRSKFNTLYKSIGFVIGFSIIFVAMGASVTSLGKLLIKYQDIVSHEKSCFSFNACNYISWSFL